jgi:hypothetical protein
MSKAGAVAGAGLGLLAAGAMVAAKAAAADAQSQAILAVAMRKTTGASDSAIAGMEDWISSASAATGVADDQLRPALGTLLRATGDAGKSQEAMALAMDISAATGKDLGSVSAALAKGYSGSTTALGKLVPGLDKGVLASKDMTKISAELARVTGGAAAANAETAAGKYARMQIALDETTESIGGALLPVLGLLAGVLMTAAQWAQENSTVFLVLASVLGTVALIVVAVSLAQKVMAASTAIASAATAVWTGIQWLWNAAMAANPVGLIVLGIIALVAIIVLAYNKSETFRRIVQAAFAAVTTAVRAVIDWIGPKLSAVWEVAKAAASVVINVIKGYIEAWTTVIRTVATVIASVLVGAFNTLKRIADPIIGALQTAFAGVKAVLDPIIGAIQTIIDLIGKIEMPSLPSWVPIIGSDSAARSFSAPSVVSAPSFGRMALAAAAPSIASGVTRSGGSRSGLVVNVYGTLDPQGTARAVQRVVHDADVRTGRRRFV